MKTKIFLLFIILPFLSQATVWRVNGKANVDAEFSTIQEAVDNASSGDTIYVEPLSEGQAYAGATIDKTLFLYGTGYYLEENDSNQYALNESIINPIRFNPGSEGSLLSGFVTTGTLNIPGVGSGHIILNACCITVENCNYPVSSTSNTSFLLLFSNADNCIIRNCHYVAGRVEVQPLPSDTSEPGVTGTIIFNSIFEAVNGRSASSVTIGDLTVDHCTVRYAIGVENIPARAKNTTFINSVISSSSISPVCSSGCTFINTMGQEAIFNGSQVDIVLSDFEDDFIPSLNEHPELRYSLSEVSAGKNAATDGTDCGLFGGPTPYRLSGIPEIPAIFQLVVDTQGNANSQTLDVNLKAKSHD